MLVYEFIMAGIEGHTAGITKEVFLDFFRIVLDGLAVGFGCAYLLYFLIRREYVPKYLLNVFTLATVLMGFVLADFYCQRLRSADRCGYGDDPGESQSSSYPFHPRF